MGLAEWIIDDTCLVKHNSEKKTRINILLLTHCVGLPNSEEFHFVYFYVSYSPKSHCIRFLLKNSFCKIITKSWWLSFKSYELL